MKKILLFLLTFLACTYSAQAQDYVYLVGTPTGWTEPIASNKGTYDSWKLEKSGDVYVGTFTIAAKAEFRFYSALNGWNNNSWGPDEGHQVGYQNDETKAKRYISTDGTQYVMNSGWQNQWGIAEAGTYTFTVDLTNAKLSVTAQGSTSTPTYTELWLRGSWNDNKGWSISEGGAAIKFATTDGITYTLSVDGATINGKEWKIADSGYKYQYGASSDISTGTHNLTENSQKKFINLDDACTYDLVYNYNTHVLTVTAQSTTPIYPEMKLACDAYGWSGSEGLFTNNGDGTWTLTLHNINDLAGKGFKILDGNRNLYGNGTTSGGVSFTVNEPCGLYSNNVNAVKFDSSLSGSVVLSLSKYAINDDGKGGKFYSVELTITADTPTYPELWVRGYMTKNNWDPTEGYKMTCTDGVYTLENVALSNTEFKIGTDETGEGVDWKYSFGAASDAEGALDVTADGQEWTIYDVVRGNNLHIGEVSGNVDITFTPNFTAKTGILIIKLHDTPVVGYKVYVVRPVGAEEIPNIYCYGDFSNGEWPGKAMDRAANDLVLTEGERPIYVYPVEKACKVIINTDPSKDEKGPWRYPANGKEGIDINEDTIIIFSGESTATWEAFDPDNVSGIEDVEISNEAPVEFYNLQGVRVDGELTPGLYIRRQGNNASKVLIR